MGAPQSLHCGCGRARAGTRAHPQHAQRERGSCALYAARGARLGHALLTLGAWCERGAGSMAADRRPHIGASLCTHVSGSAAVSRAHNAQLQRACAGVVRTCGAAACRCVGGGEWVWSGGGPAAGLRFRLRSGSHTRSSRAALPISSPTQFGTLSRTVCVACMADLRLQRTSG
jgi:hypothetical protein